MNGTDRNGKQVFFCFECSRAFKWTNISAKELQLSKWFHKWISEGYSIRQLTVMSKYSSSKLRSIIHSCLASEQVVKYSFSDEHYLLCDGTFIEGRKNGLFVIMNTVESKVVAGRYGVKEKQSELIQYFSELKTRGLNPKSFTTDGNTAISRALRTVWPEVIVQRCLVHIQRQGLMWCRVNPKSRAGQKLRALCLQVTKIRNIQTAENFLQDFFNWDRYYGHRLLMGSTRGWVVSDLIRARSMLLNAIPDMFHFLNDSNIPNTTNALEGYFSRLKAKYWQHRGLARESRENYFRWYLSVVKR